MYMHTEISSNPLLQEWDTPRQTVPFSRIAEADYAPAIRKAIELSRNEVERIAMQADAPTFDNTMEALENSSRMLDRAAAVLFNLNECCTTDTLQAIVEELVPEITRFETGVWMDRRLYERVDSLWERRNALDLTAEQLQLIETYMQRFVRNGVNLDDDKKRQFAGNAERLSALTEQFGRNALNDTNDFTLHIVDADDLRGLPDTVVHAAREEAKKRGLDGWLFTLQAPSYRPFMTFAENRELRRQMWVAYNSRGNRAGGNDNNETIRQIVDLRLQQARLLGYGCYAAYSLQRTMAHDVETVEHFLDNLLQACEPHAVDDLRAVERYAHENGFEGALQCWDFSYWSEQLKKERYAFDSELLRPYFRLERVRQGIFHLYGVLYGLSFVENDNIEVYHPDVKAYEVFDGTDFLGVLYLDMFPRASKRSGAWMTDFRPQADMSCRRERPHIQIVCNFAKPVGDTPSLLSFDELTTFMHEFGHAMHGMLSRVHYPSLSGTSVKRDFVEMPSQVMENWCYEPEFLATFAQHYLTGETIPDEYVEKIVRSKYFMSGWLFLRQLNFGLTDMAFHTLEAPLTVAPEALEHSVMHELLPVVPGTCTSTAFTHIFAGGYAAGYYGYKWAEALDADIFSRFKRDGIFNKETAAAFRHEILEKGGSEPPAVLFRNFMGRDPDNGALLKRIESAL
ncbi:MAG: M3 family metallopeptidase [Bacteroidales bacterium]|nr:M3 family metallopeptidase [Bacteroidales bacterium]